MNRKANRMAVWLSAAWLLGPWAFAQDAAPVDGHSPEDEHEFELPADDRAAIEQLTCRNWHDRSIGHIRASEQYDHTRATVSFECESHATFDKFLLHSIGDCYRTKPPWQCRNDGLSVDLNYGHDKYWVQFGDIPPQVAVGIIAYLHDATWQGEPVRKELAETMSLHAVNSRPDEFWLEIEHDTDRAMDIVSIPVTRECDRGRCVFRVTGVNHTRASF